jgi:predicted PurR-regulated permease PerM
MGNDVEGTRGPGLAQDRAAPLPVGRDAPVERAPQPASLGAGAHALLVAAALVVTIAGLKLGAQIIVPLLLAGFVATLGIPPIAALQRRMPMWAAASVVAVVFVGLGSIVAALVANAVRGLRAKLPTYEARLQQRVDEVLDTLHGFGIAVDRESITETVASVDPMDYVGMAVGAVGGVLANTGFVVLFSLFIFLEAAGLPSKLRAALGDDRQPSLERFGHVLTDINRYVWLKTQVCLGTAACATLVCFLVGVDAPILWGLIAFMLAYVPALGFFIASLPPAILAFVAFGWEWGAVVIAGFMIVDSIAGNLVEPRLLGRTLGLSPLVVILSLVFWGWVWGIVGMFLSVPLTMLVKILLEHTEDFAWIAVLMGSAAEARAQVAELEDAERRASASRSDGLRVAMGVAEPATAKEAMAHVVLAGDWEPLADPETTASGAGLAVSQATGSVPPADHAGQEDGAGDEPEASAAQVPPQEPPVGPLAST